MATGFLSPQAQAQAPLHRYDINLPPDTLAEALKQLRTQTDSLIVFSPQQLDGARITGLSGSYTVAEALAELLKQTEFSVRLDERGTIIVLPAQQTVPTEAAAPALSSRPPPTPIEEITVTAEKREELAKDVPASISALTGSTLSQRGLNGIDDYGSYVPGLELLSNQRGFGQIVLRGITTGTTQPTAAVGTYIDDVPYGSSTAFGGGNLVIADIDPFDVQRIEIARGPQGTLYGAGTLAGLVKFVTTPPKLDSWESQGELDAGGTKGGGFDQAAKMETNVPLGDRTALRFDLYERRDSGYIDDVGTNNNDENYSDVRGGRLSILSKPTDDFTIRFTSLYQQRYVGGTPAVDINPLTAHPLFGDFEQSRVFRESASQQYQLHDLKLDWDLGFGDLVSSTSYGRSLAHANTDYTPLLGHELLVLDEETLGITLPKPPTVSFPTSFTTDKFTEELRIASPQSRNFNWLAGAFYTYEWSNARSSILASLPNLTLPTVAATAFQEEEPSRFREYAAFGDIDYYFAPDLDLTAGARWSRNRQSFEEISTGALDTFSNPNGISTDLGSSAGSSWTFRAAPRWRVTDEVTTYMEASSGYRPGGQNVPLPQGLANTPASKPGSFTADTLWNYEIGMKSEFFDKRLSFDADAFIIDWRNIQLQSTTPIAPIVTNGGSASSKGFEYEANYHPIDGVILGLAGAYTYAVLTSDTPFSVGGIKGNTLPTVPRWSGAFTADYTFPMFGVLDGMIGGSYRFTGARNSAFPGDQSQSEPDIRLPAYGQLDLRTGVAIDDSTITLFVDNVLDARGALDVQDSLTPTLHETIVRPLAIGLQLTTAF
jgi:iron complex outermembrane recepter protein